MNNEMTQTCYFRMLVSYFDKLHRRFDKSLQRRNTKMMNYIQPVEMFALQSGK